MVLKELKKAFNLTNDNEYTTFLSVPENDLDGLIRYLRVMYPQMCKGPNSDFGDWYIRPDLIREGDWIVNSGQRLYDPIFLQHLTGER